MPKKHENLCYAPILNLLGLMFMLGHLKVSNDVFISFFCYFSKLRIRIKVDKIEKQNDKNPAYDLHVSIKSITS
jgi:hypothetical protein